MSVSKLSIANVNYTEVLNRPSTTKGSVFGNNGTDNFELVPPAIDCDVLTSDSAESAGIKWDSTTLNSGLCFVLPTIFSISGVDGYFLVDASVNPIPLVMPESNIFYMTVYILSTGWAVDPTQFNGGSITFTIGYVAANTSNVVANFNNYAGSPHFTIDYTDINTNANKYRTFTTALDVDITAGQQLSIKVNITLTQSSPSTTGNFGAMIIAKGL